MCRTKEQLLQTGLLWNTKIKTKFRCTKKVIIYENPEFRIRLPECRKIKNSRKFGEK